MGCPDCGRGSTRVHSRYRRTRADAAAGGRPVLIKLSVRWLFCDAPGCGRRTFAEQVEGLTVCYQRRSPLLQHLVEMAGVLLAGRGGARLLQILKAPLSRMSVLFHLMRMPLLPSAPTPRVLGVDDFELYADTYGRCWWTPTPDCRSICGPAAMPGSWLLGCGHILASASCAGTARWSTGRALPKVLRTRCRSVTASTCGRGSRSGCRTWPLPTAREDHSLAVDHREPAPLRSETPLSPMTHPRCYRVPQNRPPFAASPSATRATPAALGLCRRPATGRQLMRDPGLMPCHPRHKRFGLTRPGAAGAESSATRHPGKLTTPRCNPNSGPVTRHNARR